MGDLRARRKNIHIDFDSTIEATPDAILALLSKIRDPHRSRRSTFKGNFPKNAEVQRLLIEIGFYKYVSSSLENIPARSGLISQKRSKKVEPEVAYKMLQFASEYKFKEERKMGGAYRILIECMANTRDHASPNQKESIDWWTVAYRRESDGKVCFVFIDNGVGIFDSVKITDYQKTWGPFLGLSSRAELLETIVDGTVGSRTGLAYRGKGLPAIKSVLKRGEVGNLSILTNDVIGHISDSSFERLDVSFGGTVVYWEV